MGEVRRAPWTAKSHDDLLRLTRCETDDDFIELLWAFSPFDQGEGDIQLDWRFGESDTMTIVFFPDGCENAECNLQYPFTLKEMWADIESTCERVERGMKAHWLPETADVEDSYELIDELALFLEVNKLELVEAIGGGWVSFESDYFIGSNSTQVNWYGAGDPLQVVMGITGELIQVVEPLEFHASLAGPAHVDMGKSIDVWLGGDDTLAELRGAIESITRKTRRRLGICHGCREYLEVSKFRDSTKRYCRGCTGYYFNVIIC